jgi:hypothetical protein
MPTIVRHDDAKASGDSHATETEERRLKRRAIHVDCGCIDYELPRKLIHVVIHPEHAFAGEAGAGPGIRRRAQASLDGRVETLNEPLTEEAGTRGAGTRQAAFPGRIDRGADRPCINGVGGREVFEALSDAPTLAAIRLPV